jgi:hypothetical protein
MLYIGVILYGERMHIPKGNNGCCLGIDFEENIMVLGILYFVILIIISSKILNIFKSIFFRIFRYGLIYFFPTS